jgi:hypothetical protein
LDGRQHQAKQLAGGKITYETSNARHEYTPVLCDGAYSRKGASPLGTRAAVSVVPFILYKDITKSIILAVGTSISLEHQGKIIVFTLFTGKYLQWVRFRCPSPPPGTYGDNFFNVLLEETGMRLVEQSKSSQDHNFG